MYFIELITFYLGYIFLFSSALGYGFVFNYFLKINFENSNGILAILGLIFLTLLAYISSFFTHHGYLFNCLVHLLGFIFFIKNCKKIINLRFLIFFISVIFVGLLISKTHDDFPFYHLQQSLNLSRNKIQIGLSNLDFTNAHHSSIFYLNSLFFLPKFNYYYFNAPSHIFFTGATLALIELSKNEKKIIFLKFFSFISVFYFLLKFTRSAEYGTDIVGQILVVLFVYFSMLFLLSSNNNRKNNYLIISGLLIVYCCTVKTYFTLYLILYFYLIFNLKVNNILNFIKFYKIYIIFIFLLTLSYIFLNLFSSGCIIYPMPALCFENLFWAMPKNEVLEYKVWYEIWAKSIAGTGYKMEDSQNLIKNFSWIKIWFNNYFFGRFTDNLMLLLFISAIFKLFFPTKSKISLNQRFNLKILYIIILFILLFWFFKHPTLRYGGYAPLMMLVFIPLCYILAKNKFDNKKYNKLFNVFIAIALLFFFSKNILRINNEINRNDMYKYTNFPYFFVPKVDFEKINLNKNIIVYKPIDNNCWDVPSPCLTSNKVKAKKLFGYDIFYRIK